MIDDKSMVVIVNLEFSGEYDNVFFENFCICVFLEKFKYFYYVWIVEDLKMNKIWCWRSYRIDERWFINKYLLYKMNGLVIAYNCNLNLFNYVVNYL